MKSKYGNDYFIAISKPIFLEIANKNINKGKTYFNKISAFICGQMINYCYFCTE